MREFARRPPACYNIHAVNKISALTLVLSDHCNFSCPYCPQRKGGNRLGMEDFRAFLGFLRPRLARHVWLAFYGGEPLLNWPLLAGIVAATRRERQARFRFTLTTNGSLLDEKRILFLKENRFHLILSYDGLAQEYRDAGSVAVVEAALDRLRRSYPAGYLVNGVFTPRTVPLLAASFAALMKQGHRRLRYSLDRNVRWGKKDLDALERQLARLAGLCLGQRRETGRMPLENFARQGRRGVFACFAGRDRLALLPDRSVWGCEIFHTLLGHDPRNPDQARYRFGSLDEFISMPDRARASVSANYAELRQDYFFTEKKELCGLCADLERCAVCPATAALTTGTPGVLPSWICRVQGITRRAAAGIHGDSGRLT